MSRHLSRGAAAAVLVAASLALASCDDTDGSASVTGTTGATGVASAAAAAAAAPTPVGAGRYYLPLDADTELRCVIGDPTLGASVGCENYSDTDWTDPDGKKASGVALNFGPARATGVLGNIDWPDSAAGSPHLASGTVYTVGDLTLDLTGDGKVTATVGDESAWFTADDFGPRATAPAPTTAATTAPASAAASASGGVGDTCGSVDRGQFPRLASTTVEVSAGTVDCDAALAAVQAYLDTPADASHGNTNMRTVDGWTCAMPTVLRSQESGTAVSCSFPDGGTVTVPLG